MDVHRVGRPGLDHHGKVDGAIAVEVTGDRGDDLLGFDRFGERHGGEQESKSEQQGSHGIFRGWEKNGVRTGPWQASRDFYSRGRRRALRTRSARLLTPRNR